MCLSCTCCVLHLCFLAEVSRDKKRASCVTHLCLVSWVPLPSLLLCGRVFVCSLIFEESLLSFTFSYTTSKNDNVLSCYTYARWRAWVSSEFEITVFNVAAVHEKVRTGSSVWASWFGKVLALSSRSQRYRFTLEVSLRRLACCVSIILGGSIFRMHRTMELRDEAAKLFRITFILSGALWVEEESR